MKRNTYSIMLFLILLASSFFVLSENILAFAPGFVENNSSIECRMPLICKGIFGVNFVRCTNTTA